VTTLFLYDHTPKVGHKETPLHTEKSYLMDTATPPTLHRLSYAMERTGLSRSGLYRVINLGQLKVIKIGRSVRISESELTRFIQSLEA
jgi:excisionase family DNA binding protein